MKAIILAAGLGVRLGKRTEEVPKALIEVGGVKLIDRVLGFVEDPFVTEVVVIGGYCFDKLKQHLQKKDIRILFNPNFRDGNIFTLKTAFELIDGDFLMLNVDHIYPKELFKHVLNNISGITAMCDFDRQLVADDMKIKLDQNKRLKKISKTLTDFDGGYIGMTYCSKEMLTIYKRNTDETLEIYGPKSSVESILGHMAANDVPINICDTSGFYWPEVDTEDDLKVAEKSLLRGQNF